MKGLEPVCGLDFVLGYGLKVFRQGLVALTPPLPAGLLGAVAFPVTLRWRAYPQAEPSSPTPSNTRQESGRAADPPYPTTMGLLSRNR